MPMSIGCAWYIQRAYNRSSQKKKFASRKNGSSLLHLETLIAKIDTRLLLSTCHKAKGRPGRPLAQAEVTSMQRPLSRFKPVLFMYFCGPLGYTYATELLPGDSTLFDLYKTAKHYNIAPSSRIYASKHYSRKVHAIEVHHTKPANIQCKSKHFMM